MSVVHQAVLPLPRPGFPRLRACRRPFTPSEPAGPYKLPRPILDRLAVTLAPFRNRDAAFALAVFLGRFWSAPRRLGLPFPIDRRALTDHAALDLTEAQVRGAISTLEAIGFLDRADDRRRYQATEGGLHRKPILFAFGLDTVTAFEAANRMAFARAQAAAGKRRTPEQGRAAASLAPRPSLAWKRPVATSPKDTTPLEKELIMGEVTRGSAEGRTAKLAELDAGLAAALARLGAGVLGDR